MRFPPALISSTSSLPISSTYLPTTQTIQKNIETAAVTKVAVPKRGPPTIAKVTKVAVPKRVPRTIETVGKVAVSKRVRPATETVGFVAMSYRDITAGKAMMPAGIMSDESVLDAR